MRGFLWRGENIFHYFFNFLLSLVDLIILFCIDLIFTVFACAVVRPMGNLCFYCNLCFVGFAYFIRRGRRGVTMLDFCYRNLFFSC